MQVVRDHEIRSMLMVFVTGGKKEEQRKLYADTKEFLVELKQQLEVIGDFAGPLIVYSMQAALSDLKVVFRLQEFIKDYKAKNEGTDNVELSVKVFDVRDVATIPLK